MRVEKALYLLLAVMVVTMVLLVGLQVARVRTSIRGDVRQRADSSGRPAPDPGPASQGAPQPTPTPRNWKMSRITYERSHAPGEDLVIEFRGGESLRTQGDGRFPSPPGSRLATVYDEQTSLTLAIIAVGGQGQEILVPEPVRLRGRITPAQAATLRLGSGKRLEAAARLRLEERSQIRPMPGENQPWGIELPPSPGVWREVPLHADGSFVTPWFLAEAAPQLVGSDVAGRLVIRDVPLPGDVAPRTTIDVGELTLRGPTGLIVSVELPEGDESADIGLGMVSAIPDTDHLAETALILASLDRVGGDLADFANRRGNLHVTHGGETIFAPLPPFKEIDMVARGAVPEKTPHRKISIREGELTRVTYALDDLFPTISETAPMEGRLVLEGTDIGIEGATVVMSSYRTREEATTGSDGTFSFPRVPKRMELSFYIEALDEAMPPAFSHNETKQFPRYPADTETWRPVWSVPSLRWLLIDRPASETGNPVVAIEERAEGGRWNRTDVRDVFFAAERNEIQVQIPRPGDWRALLSYGPLVLLTTQVANFGLMDLEKRVRVESTPPPRPARVKVVTWDGRPAAHVTVLVGGPVASASPLELVTDAQGMIALELCNTPGIELRISGQSGGFDGPVEFNADRLAVVKLSRDAP